MSIPTIKWAAFFLHRQKNNPMEKPNLEQNVTIGKRGGKKLDYEGYSYNFKEFNGIGMFWRCNKRGCNGAIVTSENYVMESVKSHIHPPDFSKAMKKNMIDLIKERSITTNESSRDIVYNVMQSSENISQIYNIKYLKEQVTKFRNANNFTFEKDYDIPLEIRKTYNDIDFVFFDSGMFENNRIIIFATQSDLIHLFNSKIWVIDGTFKVVPNDFEQLCTIQAKIREKFVPLVFCLMKKRDLFSYMLFLEQIKHKFLNLQPELIIMDFEHGIFTSCKSIFPQSILNGCLFHLSQIVWRKLQGFKYTCMYKENSEFRFNINLIMALSFVPYQYIETQAKFLMEYFVRENVFKEAIEVLNWFTINFIDKETCLPNHHPEFWSVYKRTLNKQPRTTNSLEGYHRHLNSVCEVSNPTLLSLGKELIKENFLVKKSLNDSHYLYFTKTKKLQNELSEIDEIVMSFNKFYDVEFLKAVAINFKFELND